MRTSQAAPSPIAFTWMGGAGSWTDPSKWVSVPPSAGEYPSRLASRGDTATIAAAGSVVATGSGTQFRLASLTIGGGAAGMAEVHNPDAGGSTLVVSGPCQVLANGILRGATTLDCPDVTVSGLLAIGQITHNPGGNAMLHITASGTLEIARTFQVSGNGSAVVNDGTVLWESGTVNVATGTAFNNTSSGKVVIGNPGPNPITESWGGGSFLNSGTVQMTMPPPVNMARITTTIIANTGTIDLSSGSLRLDNVVQTAGTIRMSGGTLTSRPNAGQPGIQLNGGTLEGSGTIDGRVINAAATIRPGGPGGIGTLTLLGPYTQETGGTLELDVTKAAWDQIFYANIINLGGLVTPDYTGPLPAPGDTFTFLSKTLTAPASRRLNGIFTTATVSAGPVLFNVDYAPATIPTSAFLSVSLVNHPPMFTFPTPGASIPVHFGVNLGLLAPLIATATDVDVPPQTLTYSIVSGPPWLSLAGARLTGDVPLIFFRPADYPVTLKVTDNGLGLQSDTVSFTLSAKDTLEILRHPLRERIPNLTWTSVLNRRYRVQHKRSLSQANWEDISDVITATDPLTTYRLPDPQDGFYRLAELP